MAPLFFTLICMHMHVGSSPVGGTVPTEPLESLFTRSLFVFGKSFHPVVICLVSPMSEDECA